MGTVNLDDLKELEEELSKQLHEKETSECDPMEKSLLDILFSEEMESLSAKVDAISSYPTNSGQMMTNQNA